MSWAFSNDQICVKSLGSCMQWVLLIGSQNILCCIFTKFHLNLPLRNSLPVRQRMTSTKTGRRDNLFTLMTKMTVYQCALSAVQHFNPLNSFTWLTKKFGFAHSVYIRNKIHICCHLFTPAELLCDVSLFPVYCISLSLLQFRRVPNSKIAY